MGRIRTVKPELFQHSDLFDAEEESKLPLRLAFIGLFTCCDREGRFKWRPRELKVAVLPYDKTDFSRVLDALLTRGFLVKYSSHGEVFGAIPSWQTHQYVNGKEPASSIPEPIKDEQLDASVTRDSPVEHASVTDGVKERKGKEGKGSGVAALPACVPVGPWEAFVKMRKQSNRPFTDEARTLALERLEKLSQQGNDAGEVLNQSVLNGWQGVFPLKHNANGHSPGPRKIRAVSE